MEPEASDLGIVKDNVQAKGAFSVGYWMRKGLLILVCTLCVLTRLYLKKKMKYLLKFQRLHALDLISHEIKLHLEDLV